LLDVFRSDLYSLSRCLKPTTGRVLVAAKVHYFGVGGGLRQFEDLAKECGTWEVETAEKIEAGVKREILQMKKIKRKEAAAAVAEKRKHE
jgi:hypothetical protein